MALRYYPKPSLEDFIKQCTPLAIIDSLEQEFRERVGAITAALLNFEPSGNPVDNLSNFLKADADFLGVILSITNLSQEKFLRILSAERFAKHDYNPEWTIDMVHRKIRDEPGFVERIALLFLEGRNSAVLVQHVAGFYLDQLGLPTNWDYIVRDPQPVQNVIRRKLTGEYTDAKGDAIEDIMRKHLDMLEAKYGISHGKGQVKLVGKEVDHALPSVDEPYILIMSSYMETTGSGQTARANEQSDMFSTVQKDNVRYGTKRVFVNFVDGAGWLARRSDLRKMYDGCDHIVNLKTLDRLEAIICKYVPDKFFVHGSRPEIVEG